MKILLISVNREKMPFPVFPLGLAYLVKALKEEDHLIEVLDLCFSMNVPIDLKYAIHKFQPDLIGLSLRNLDNLTYPTSISYLKEVEEVVSICRQSSPSKLALGGSGFSLLPKDLLQHLDIDFGIVGEGEEVFLQLVKFLESKSPISPTPSLLIKGLSFPHLIEGARVLNVQAPDRTLLKHVVTWKREGWGIFRQSEAVPFHVFIALTLCWKVKRSD